MGAANGLDLVFGFEVEGGTTRLSLLQLMTCDV